MVPSQETEQSNMKGIQDDSLVAPCTGKQGQLPRTRHAWGRQAAIPDVPNTSNFPGKTKQVGRASRMTVWPLHAPANRANYPGLDMHGAGKPPTQIDLPKAALNIYIYSPYKSPVKENYISL